LRREKRMSANNGDEELRPRFMPRREVTKKLKGDVPESVADDFAEYCRFVAETAGVDSKEVTGEVLAAAIKDFLKADKAFPKWKAKQLEDVSGDEVEQALAGLGAGASQETPRPAERPARPAAASSSGGGSSAAGKSSAATPPPPSSRPTTSTAAQT
jgi:hypothetical protein